MQKIGIKMDSITLCRYMPRGSFLGPIAKAVLFVFLSFFVLFGVPIITIQMKATNCNSAIGTLDTETARLTYYPSESCYSLDAIVNSTVTFILIGLLLLITAYGTFFVNSIHPRKSLFFFLYF